MGTALQQVSSKRQEQQVSYPEETGQSLPSRGASERPAEDEIPAGAGNQERAAARGSGASAAGKGGGTGDSPGGMKGYREQAQAERPEAISQMEGFTQCEQVMLAAVGICISRRTEFEKDYGPEAFLGGYPPVYDPGIADFDHDLGAYPALVVTARRLGLQVEATRGFTEVALRESDALRSYLVDAGLGTVDGGGFRLDQAAVARALGLARQGFAATGKRPDMAGAALEIEQGPSTALQDFDGAASDLVVAAQGVRAWAADQRRDAAAEDLEVLTETQETGGKLVKGGEQLCKAAAGDPAALFDGEDVGKGVVGLILSEPLSFFEALVGSERASARGEKKAEVFETMEEARKAYLQAAETIEGQQEQLPASIDDYANHLGNLAATGGKAGARSGEAVRHLARIHAVHLTLRGLLQPLEQRQIDVLVAQQEAGALAERHSIIEGVNLLRSDCREVSEFYGSVGYGLEALHADVGAREAELAGASQDFGAFLDEIS